MLKHTFTPREDLEGRVVIHPVGSAPNGVVLGEALEGEEAQTELVVESDGTGASVQKLESYRAYSHYLDESVEEDEVEQPQTDAVAERKADVAESGSEDQVDANALGDLSDEGEPSASEASETDADAGDTKAGTKAKRTSSTKSKGGE